MDPRTKTLAWKTILPFVVAAFSILFFTTRCGASMGSVDKEGAVTKWDDLEKPGVRADPAKVFQAFWREAKQEPWMIADGRAVVVCSKGQLAGTDNIGKCKKLLLCINPKTSSFYPKGYQQYEDDKRACAICKCP
ncbi:MAG: hypothetical protein UR53_C0001G0148 [Candidatus Magasanikbacteria bacterium GW2011_GWC2_34_16]|uniref:Uncharacterized protein n=2 Tax=Candidatus Magasanikiibacteriota TaxID=1752731 RepID=A0A0G0KIP6_9BACT|nr:MAG: hypothetical protein UR53_C0001G0148 [Candidatus Magasanikbacteria bacterium GW2011_GWC2_34_16]KKQ40461.1 MAG: hypothetical protein US58_C0020G0002 [Candidatus Magasanikbacteria bacterium GW2011_GWA2_37_8]